MSLNFPWYKFLTFCFNIHLNFFSSVWNNSKNKNIKIFIGPILTSIGQSIPMWSRHHASSAWDRGWWEWVSLAIFSFLRVIIWSTSSSFFFPCLTHLSRARAKHRRQKKYFLLILNHIAHIVCALSVRTKTMNNFLLSSSTTTTSSTWLDLVCVSWFCFVFFWNKWFFLFKVIQCIKSWHHSGLNHLHLQITQHD